MDFFDDDENDTTSTTGVDDEKFWLATSIYKSVWQEFYTWEQQECRNDILSLQQISQNTMPLSTDISLSNSPGDRVPGPIDAEFVPFFVWEFETAHQTQAVSESYELHYDIEINDTHFIDPYSMYEACTPTARNIGKDEIWADLLPFMPYADNPSFTNRDEYLSSFFDFQWLSDFLDPDGS